MKRGAIILCACAVLATVTAVADILPAGDLVTPVGDPALIEILSGVSYVPPRPALDSALGGGAVDTLISIATGAHPVDDPGVRLRAYRALSEYPDPTVEDALRDAVAAHGAGTDPMDNLLVRAAMDSLARIAGESAVDDISVHLTHASRDVRAAAARALAECGSQTALPLLRSRLLVEPESQVKAALSRAIRDLDGS